MRLQKLTEIHRLDVAAYTPQSKETAKHAPDTGGKPLRVLMPSYRSAPYTGGQGIYIHYLSKALVELGHDVHVVSGPPYPRLDERVKLIKLPSLDLYSVENAFRAFRWRHFLSFANLYEWFAHNTGKFGEPYTFGRRLVKYFRTTRHQYDVVHDNQSLSWGILRLHIRGVPVVATIHHPITKDRDIAFLAAKDTATRFLIGRWYSFLDMQKKVAVRLPALIAVSENTKRDVEQDFGVESHRMAIIHNGVDTQHFRPLPGVKRSQHLIITTASADVPLKGLSYLLQAFRKLAASNPELELLIIGKPHKKQTSELIAQWGLGPRIRFMHNISTDALVQAYAKATMAVCPSLYEGFGFPAAEAMACGVPVVSTTGGALPEVVGDAGLLVPPRDSDALADAIEQLLHNPKLCAELGTRGRNRVISRFSWTSAAKSYVALYRRVIRDAHRTYG